MHMLILTVRANAETTQDLEIKRPFLWRSGIGLARTEHICFR